MFKLIFNYITNIELLENRELTLDLHFKYLEEEFEIRVESIKNNLDDLLETFRKDLVQIKKEIIE